ncbi:MAG: 30S ribosomal protein S13 [Bacilli bacterium]|jgi:small subunit ribosomal protein S13|nr:30S ribosomal protein S13 [Bacilli bacterium]
MARIKNIELPKDKALFIGLTAIYGIGQSTAKKICKAVNIDPEMKVRDVTNEQENILRGEVDKYLVEGELRREVQMNIKNKMEIGSYQGIRHKKGLPVHGQSTRSNAKTRKGKGKVVANKKKATK